MNVGFNFSEKSLDAKNLIDWFMSYILSASFFLGFSFLSFLMGSIWLSGAILVSLFVGLAIYTWFAINIQISSVEQGDSRWIVTVSILSFPIPLSTIALCWYMSNWGEAFQDFLIIQSIMGGLFILAGLMTAYKLRHRIKSLENEIYVQQSINDF